LMKAAAKASAISTPLEIRSRSHSRAPSARGGIELDDATVIGAPTRMRQRCC
jgi:hypothetical protein